MLRPPVLSEWDPSTEGEGSIDPLGLQPGYERLADRVLPAVTVRMGRPRYLTAIAVSAHVCAGSDWDTDSVAADGITPPWQVFEWLVIESFVRNRGALANAYGIPGIQKVEAAIRNGRHVSAPGYLKTPSVFGFTGIFRRLARATRVLTDAGHLDDAGYELLKAWSIDQGLVGFLDGQSNTGADFRESLRRAVRHGMEKGCTTYQPAEFWQSLAARLEPGRVGKNERSVLLRLIQERSGQPESVAALVRQLQQNGRPLDYVGEAAFIRKLLSNAPAELKDRLSAINDYEAFCRPITDCFDWTRHLSTICGGGPVGPDDFAKSPRAKVLTKDLVEGVKATESNGSLIQVVADLHAVIQRFQNVASPGDLFRAVLDHHNIVQENKPPDGKRAWLESVRGKVTVRAAYSVKNAPDPASAYVHEYRVPTFSRFLNELGAL